MLKAKYYFAWITETVRATVYLFAEYIMCVSICHNNMPVVSSDKSTEHIFYK